MSSSRKKNSPTLAELHKIFPPHESVKKYSHGELLKLYNELQGRELVVPESTELIDDYKNYLEKETITGGSHLDELNTEDFAVGKSYKYETDDGTIFLVDFGTRTKLTNGSKGVLCTFQHIYLYDVNVNEFTNLNETETILYDHVSGTEYYEVNSKDPTFKKLRKIINENNGVEDTESLKSRNSFKKYASFQSTTDSLIKRAPTFIRQCRPHLDNTVKSAEIYGSSHYQKLKALESHKYIFGMQNVPYDCKELYQFMKYLRQDKKIKRYACLQCGPNEEDMWKYVGLRVEGLEESFFYNRQIQDYTSYTFENAMAILKLIHDGKDTIVFHCTAGWGRTGSVMFLILLYFSAKHNINVLRKPLTRKTHFTDSELEATLLAKEYSSEAAKEFYELNGTSCKLRSDRMNIAYQAVAHTLSLYDEGNPEIAYIQYNDYDNLEDQSTIFTEFVLQDKKDIIILADGDGRLNSTRSRVSNKTIKSNRSSNKSIKSNRSSRRTSSRSSRRSSKTTKKSAGWFSNLMGID
jgi:protein-tyrosine phosphatase